MVERSFSNLKEVAAWILGAPFDKLEQRVRGFNSLNQAKALDWARSYQGGNEAKIKLQVAIIGTLASSELDTMNQ